MTLNPGQKQLNESTSKIEPAAIKVYRDFTKCLTCNGFFKGPRDVISSDLFKESFALYCAQMKEVRGGEFLEKIIKPELGTFEWLIPGLRLDLLDLLVLLLLLISRLINGSGLRISHSKVFRSG